MLITRVSVLAIRVNVIEMIIMIIMMIKNLDDPQEKFMKNWGDSWDVPVGPPTPQEKFMKKTGGGHKGEGNPHML